MTTKNLGSEGFRWFIGFVESLEDRDKLGNIKVRVPDVHGNLPTVDLPFATVMTPPQSASHLGVGLSPNGIEIGSMVFGFFMDGYEGNLPVVIGTIPKINENNISKHDVSKLARGEEGIPKKLLGPEPPPAYSAKYPFNKTYTSKSGHAVEIDDTPGKERIHIYHKAGTYTEINSVGRKVEKIADDSYEIIVKDSVVYVGGKVNVVINGQATLSASNWDITGNVLVRGNIKATGEISDSTRNMSEDRSIYNSHIHGDSTTPNNKQ